VTLPTTPRAVLATMMVVSSENAAQLVFVNPGHADHLKRIVYRRDGDAGLAARIEGEDNGRAFAVDFPYRRTTSGCGAPR